MLAGYETTAGTFPICDQGCHMIDVDAFPTVSMTVSCISRSAEYMG
jgi:hypothetical protein